MASEERAGTRRGSDHSRRDQIRHPSSVTWQAASTARTLVRRRCRTAALLAVGCCHGPALGRVDRRSPRVGSGDADQGQPDRCDGPRARAGHRDTESGRFRESRSRRYRSVRRTEHGRGVESESVRLHSWESLIRTLRLMVVSGDLGGGSARRKAASSASGNARRQVPRRPWRFGRSSSSPDMITSRSRPLQVIESRDLVVGSPLRPCSRR